MYPTISLSKAVSLYLLALFGWFFTMYVSHQIAPDASFFTQLIVLVLAWLTCGFNLNRLILHPLIEADASPLATIHSRSSIKIACLLWWPIKYPELIVRVFFIRHA